MSDRKQLERAKKAEAECQRQTLERKDAERQWVGLTDEELLELSKDAWGRNKLHLGRSDHTGFYIDFGRAVEAKLKEKNE